MKIKVLILFISQFILSTIILIGQYYYITDECSCGPPASLGMAVTDLLYPIVWILTLIIIFFSFIAKKWMFIVFAILIVLGVHVGENVIGIKFDKYKQEEKYGNEVIVRYRNTNSKSENYFEPITITLYKDHYKIIKHIGEECGCFYLGIYHKSNDTIYFDNNIITNELNIHNKIFIELNDTIRPIDSSDNIFFKRNID